MQTITEIRLDLKNPTITPPVHAKQNDQLTRYIKAYLYDGGVPFEPPTGALAMFRAKKPDGTECFYDTNEKGEPAIVIEGNTVTAELAHQVLTRAGKVDAEINLYTADEERLTSFTFVVQVEKSALPDAEILSSDYYNILAKQIAESMGAAKDAQEAVQEVKDLAQTVSETIQQEGEAQLKAIQQSGEEQVENAKEQADRAKEYADSIDPSQFVKSVNGELPDQQGAVLLDANAIEETATRVFATPAEKEKWNRPGDIINGTLMVWQRYNAADSSTYTNPNIKYVADRFQSTGTGTIRPNPRGYGADITGSITVQYWMEPEDFALLPDPYTIYFSIDGEMLSVTKTKEGTYVSSDGNASFFQRKITNATLDWVSLYPRRPVRPYAEELALCQRYTIMYHNIGANTGAFIGQIYSDGIFRYNIQTPSNMRVKPTCSLKGCSVMVSASSGSVNYSFASSSVEAFVGNNVRCTTSAISGVPAGNMAYLRIVTGGYFLLDAEIY